MELKFANSDTATPATINWVFTPPPKPNFVLRFDDMGYKNPLTIRFEFTVKKTRLARLKYWLFCKFFPFKIERWD